MQQPNEIVLEPDEFSGLGIPESHTERVAAVHYLADMAKANSNGFIPATNPVTATRLRKWKRRLRALVDYLRRARGAMTR